MPHVEEFSVPHVDVRALIGATPEFWEYPMCDRDPLPWWSRGAVTLLEDERVPQQRGGHRHDRQLVEHVHRDRHEEQ